MWDWSQRAKWKDAINVTLACCSYFLTSVMLSEVLHHCTSSLERIPPWSNQSVTCAWASLERSWTMLRHICSFSFSPSSLFLSSSSFFVLSSLMPSSSFSLWLFSSCRKSFGPSKGCGEMTGSWKKQRCVDCKQSALTGAKLTEIDYVHPIRKVEIHQDVR